MAAYYSLPIEMFSLARIRHSTTAVFHKLSNSEWKSETRILDSMPILGLRDENMTFMN